MRPSTKLVAPTTSAGIMSRVKYQVTPPSTRALIRERSIMLNMEKKSKIMALDLRRCGIGNIVLEASLLKHERPLDATIVHDDLHELDVIDTSAFLVTDDATLVDPHLNSQLCTLRALSVAHTTGAFRRVVKPIDESLLPTLDGVNAGFCFRVKIRDMDGDCDDFMNELAISTMISESMKYDKVLVVGNDQGVMNRVERLHPNAIVIPATNVNVRNHRDHVVQWHALSRCPIVYHGIKGASGGLTSTFAATAAVYGNIHPASGMLLGVDNDGCIKSGLQYSWNGQ